MDRADAEGFVTDFNRTYEEKTELRRIFGHRFYCSEDDDGDKIPSRDKDTLRYFQIGRRTTLPVSVVTEGRYAYVSDAVVGALCEGEKSFVAERLTESAEDDGISTVVGEPARTVEAALGHVETPDHLLLPRDERHDEAVADWEEEGRLRRFGDSSYLRAPGDDEESDADCWLHRYDPTPDASDAFVLEDGGVTLVQKKGKNASPPDFGYVEEYDGIDDDMPLMVYFGDKRQKRNGEIYDEFFDIVYRVVVSEPIVREGGVCRVESS